jgi:hypothetical protein
MSIGDQAIVRFGKRGGCSLPMQRKLVTALMSLTSQMPAVLVFAK